MQIVTIVEGYLLAMSAERMDSCNAMPVAYSLAFSKLTFIWSYIHFYYIYQRAASDPWRNVLNFHQRSLNIQTFTTLPGFFRSWLNRNKVLSLLFYNPIKLASSVINAVKIITYVKDVKLLYHKGRKKSEDNPDTTLILCHSHSSFSLWPVIYIYLFPSQCRVLD